ncbi:MAG: hypothetical protein IPG45_12270 [Deltaproteobacteria bacterium]|jgi:hypothetical protein|nr:hypothetical protein [Deltaproteobacteria bacterium]
MNITTPRRASGTRALALLALMVTTTTGTACRSHTELNRQYDTMRADMMAGNWAKAAASLESSKEKIYKEEDRVMYWLNLGTLLHYAGDYPRSAEHLIKAEEEMQNLWTTSISAEASKFLVNDAVQSYGGEDFEKILVYFYTALNKVRQNQIGDALVEARRADEFLKKMRVEFEKEGEGGTLYREDAFMLWMVGLFYEIEGSWADAYLAYKAAAEAYEQVYAQKFFTPAPAFIYEDAARTAQLAGQGGDVGRWKQKGATGATLERAAAGDGEVVFIHGNGESPGKKERYVDGVMPDGYVMRIALPEFFERRPRITHVEVKAGNAVGRSELAEPVTSIALVNYTHRLPAITARAIARATAKYIAAAVAKKATEGDGSDGNRALAGALVGLVANVATAASEAADLRSWSTLPANIGVTRIWLPPGAHTLQVGYMSGGSVVKTEQIPVEIKAGERRIISVRSME